MACVAVHSHLLYGLLIVYIMIVITLFCSQLYDLSPKSPVVDDGTDNTTIDVEAFKVMMSLIVHIICTACLTICLMANNIATCAKSLPPIVVRGFFPAFNNEAIVAIEKRTRDVP
ncbi:hypothetical protein Y032_0372g162 [Ancylostoma ceylanicum]|nr:hypothetical protein Y032_0372g162 [Ancylostoma ceylanicum]